MTPELSVSVSPKMNTGGERRGLPRVSVVLPVFNEGPRLQQTILQVAAFARERPDYEWIFVNDGSSDGTRAVLEEWFPGGVDESGRVRALHLSRNGGKGRAIAQGFEAAKGELLLFTDGDLAYRLAYLPEMVTALERADVVIGSRRIGGEDGAGRPPLLRAIMGEAFNCLVRLYAGLSYRDTQAGIKGFRREAVRRIYPCRVINGYATDVEIIFLARKRRLRVAELAVQVDESHGEKPTSVNLWREPLRMLWDVVRMRYRWWQGFYD